MPNDFQFIPIEGKLSLEEATEQLVHLAKCIQRTHNNESASKNKLNMITLFESRKAGVNALMNLINEYVEQMPDQLGGNQNG